jgi:hypothetical protein
MKTRRETLRTLAQAVGVTYRIEYDQTAPLPWAVWTTGDDGIQDIIGAAYTREGAIEDARKQLRAWLP